MVENWRECKLGDVAEIVGGGTPKTSVPEYWNGNIPWLTPRDLTGYEKVYISCGERFITKEGLKSSSAKLMPKGTVLLTSRAPIGYVAIAENEICSNQGFKSLVPNFEILNSEFLYYWLKTNTDYLQQLGTGTTFAEVSGSVVKDISISLPPLQEQKAIAEILSSLDDKIDLLHRQNHTLESLANTLFRQWFIEEANPEWEEVKLGDYVDIVDNRGKTPPFSNNATKYPIIEVNALSGESRLVNCSVIKKYVAEYTYNSWFRAGHPKLYDTLLSTVGSIGEIAMFLLEKGSIAQNVIALRAKNISPFYLYENIKFIQNELKELDIGSVQPSIKVTHLLKIDFIRPNDKILKKFDEQMIDISNKILFNSEQIQTLENLRDTLLPKLISGEVRVDPKTNIPNQANL